MVELTGQSQQQDSWQHAQVLLVQHSATSQLQLHFSVVMGSPLGFRFCQQALEVVLRRKIGLGSMFALCLVFRHGGCLLESGL